MLLDTSNCLVVNEPGADRMAVGVLGAADLTVVVTEDAVLVAPNARVQEVRKLVARLREEGRRQV